MPISPQEIVMQTQTSTQSPRRNDIVVAPVLRYATGTSDLGAFLVALSPQGIAAILFGETRQQMAADLRARFAMDSSEDDSGLTDIVARVAALIANPGMQFDLPLDPAGSDFQRKVWQALRQIPAGKTASYGEIADRIGALRAVRAVAQACGANPIAVAIPCHRVVRSDGSLSGYRWGVERKAMLLRAEAAL